MGKPLDTPLIDALNNFISAGRIPMHMPGHKQGKGFDARFKDNLLEFDLTELPGLDNFHRPEGAISESMDITAKVFGARKSFFLVNGSTSGIHAAFLSCFKRGDEVLVNRNCHISVIHALMLFGIKPVFVMPEYDEEYNLALPSRLVSWKRALDEHPDVKGALVTTPDYYGICQPLAELAGLLHANGKILIVDEAHGAHFAFSGKFPETALEQGADICIQSFHKTLNALTQAAVLHVGSERVNVEKLRRAISMITTTSPSYIIMASMEYARKVAVEEGAGRYDELINHLEKMKTRLSGMENLRVVPDVIGKLKRDPTRIVIDTSLTNITGYELYDMLYNEYRIAAEMCDYCHVVFIATIADTPDDLYKVTHALLKIDRSLGKTRKKSFDFPFKTGKCSIPELYDFLDSSVKVGLTDAEGMTSAELVTPYPPGIPVLCPGEVITRDHIKYLDRLIRSGAEINGLSTDEKGQRTIRVVKTYSKEEGGFQ
ncbi:arginine decarboxylase SpeA [Thermoclostridium stercorarium subsp. stercorarium DSM 8532]|jgi:arginine/lysine/ornithine decarboxylase|uniref:Arginine decarboxylase SpeA n=2 Tax=Thermoclostridium stercorarium TaxID=1510 RepID=L7VJH5_THES1|nr:aminotransferase class I/II-fold pyridoxal phosphate-dependent enzyme [Thermoclostridium stercorarium]AGC68230.1 arginine decarboxylase SpeA [Thermoclostridium stercorarium subsp. stercorarium DSM 8532]AGI39257.1 arginine decarboxylase [Thermoclostridium stercorarium subsp. stercorarium DSM 8532]ANW98592.1 arginine decarboxylase SpeA [Thermoclostridium stercorarium subsp. thermolacticum DSM 2910]